MVLKHVEPTPPFDIDLFPAFSATVCLSATSPSHFSTELLAAAPASRARRGAQLRQQRQRRRTHGKHHLAPSVRLARDRRGASYGLARKDGMSTNPVKSFV